MHTINHLFIEMEPKEYSYPEEVLLYNKFMGGVDMNDQLREYYSVRTKTITNTFFDLYLM